MTPEEKAVIQAAMQVGYEAMGRHTRTARTSSMEELVAAVTVLINSCPQCDRGGHTCPGDGNSIAHGETDCGQHDDPYQDLAHAVDEMIASRVVERKRDECQCSRTERMYCHAEGCHGGADVKEWYPARLVDAMAGDRIRAGGTESEVIASSGPMLWHTQSRTYTGDDGKVRDFQTRWDHVELWMELSANPGRWQYPPDMEIEILCTPERAAALMLDARPVDK